jgi:signal transduction histidine kinase
MEEADDLGGWRARLAAVEAALQEKERELGEERAARIAAERLADRLAHLKTFTAALWRSPRLTDVARAAVTHGPPALGTASAVIYVPGADGATLELVSHAGLPEALLERTLPLDGRWLTCAAARTGEPQWTEGKADFLERSPGAAPLVAAGIESGVFLPLRVCDRIVGVMGLGFRGRASLPDEDRWFALMVAERTAQALDHALAHAEAERARIEAEAAACAMDAFLSTVSHELRTPLTAILGWANILRTRSPEPAVAARALATIERNAKAQAQLVEDILDVSRMATGKLRLDERTVDPVAVVSAALEVIRPAAATAGVALEAALGGDVGRITADPDRLQQIALNLLSNAVKFTPRGGRIEVRLDGRADAVELRVSDTGKGIAAGFLPHVFERFRQADAGNARSHGGLGLGLSIVRHLVELHHGSITAESGGAGLGATFTVTLPRPVLEPDDVSKGDRATPDLLRLDGVRVVVVDDNPDARELVATVLRGQGAVTVVASSAAEAFAAVVEARPDVLVSDIGMPDEDGYALLRRVRAVASLPALALTAYAGLDDARQAEVAGFDRHLAKPIAPALLVDAVARLAGRTGAPTPA